jgi:hypothetical protein
MAAFLSHCNPGTALQRKLGSAVVPMDERPHPIRHKKDANVDFLIVLPLFLPS